jgi:hypothetical protein
VIGERLLNKVEQVSDSGEEIALGQPGRKVL